MKPIHIEAKEDEIAELVLMPGDPLRAKYIAEKFLKKPKLINDVRNMLGYTGYYNDKRITVIGSGMGIPSMGIYSYELAHFYGVKKIIRIGTAGAIEPYIPVRSIIIATEARSISNYTLAFSNKKEHIEYANQGLLDKAKAVTKDRESLFCGPVLTSDAFDVYSGNTDREIELLKFEPLASEMETFGLYYMGKITDVETLALLTITDNKFHPETVLSQEEREKSLDEMITLALEVITK